MATPIGYFYKMTQVKTMHDKPACVQTSLAWPHQFRKRGKGSGNFFYSSLLRCSVQCGTNHSALFCHVSAVITTSVVNYKV